MLQGRRIAHKLYVNRGRLAEARENMKSTTQLVTSSLVPDAKDSRIAGNTSEQQQGEHQVNSSLDTSICRGNSQPVQISSDESPSPTKTETKINSFNRILELATQKGIEMVPCTRGELDVMSMNRPNQVYTFSSLVDE